MEYLDIVDHHGHPIGRTVERGRAHAEGVMHRTAHVWLIRKLHGHIEILLQKRCDTKDSFPGCYDISSAGHIPAGADFAPSAIRELKEELGLEASESDLIFCGDRIASRDEIFRDRPFHDREYSRVFALWCDLIESEFHLQAEEVSSVLWMDLDQVIDSVNSNSFPHCICPEELVLIKRTL